MKRQILFCLVIPAFCFQPFCLRAAVTDLQIPVASPWFNTGIDVVAGQRLTIVTSGWVIYGVEREKMGNADGLSPITDGLHAAGPGHVVPEAPPLSLIGKVGGTTDVGSGTILPQAATGRGVGMVGTSYTAVMTTDGRLFLGYNDQLTAFDDNMGFFSSRVITDDGQPIQGSIYTAVEISWSSTLNQLYVLQSTTDLTTNTWIDFSSLTPGTGSPISVFDSTRLQPKKFYRVISIPDPPQGHPTRRLPLEHGQ